MSVRASQPSCRDRQSQHLDRVLPSLSELTLCPTGTPGDGSNVGDRGRPFARAPSASFGPGRARVRDTHTALEHAQRNAREQQENAQRLTVQLQQAQENEQAAREQAELNTRELERQRGSLRLRLQQLQKKLADRNALNSKELKQLTHSLERAQASLAARDLEIADYSAQVAQANEAKSALQTELDDLRRVVQEAQNEQRVEEAEPTWIQEAADVLAATDSLQGTVDALTRENSALQSRLDELRRTQSLDRDVCDGLRTQIDGLRDTFAAELARAAAAAAPPAPALVPQGPPIPTEPAGQAEALYNAVVNQKVDRVRQLLAIDPPMYPNKYPWRDTPYFIWYLHDNLTKSGETKTLEKALEMLDLFAEHGYKYQMLSNFHMYDGEYRLQFAPGGEWFLGTSDKAKIVRRMIKLDMFNDMQHWRMFEGIEMGTSFDFPPEKREWDLRILPVFRKVEALQDAPIKYKLGVQMLCYYSGFVDLVSELTPKYMVKLLQYIKANWDYYAQTKVHGCKQEQLAYKVLPEIGRTIARDPTSDWAAAIKNAFDALEAMLA